uniref:Uncharacterized protein n=1 Tax=Anguilla anguilla TaxID=7936 RepID=A0A0E9QRH7_ANGAN
MHCALHACHQTQCPVFRSSETIVLWPDHWKEQLYPSHDQCFHLCTF